MIDQRCDVTTSPALVVASGFLAAWLAAHPSPIAPRTAVSAPLVLATIASETRTSVPFVRTSGLVFVEIRRGAEPPMLALFDTGASASAIDPRRSADLPALGEAEVVGTTDTTTSEMVEVRGLHLGEHALPVLRATRRDLSSLLAPPGRTVDMILGSDAFAVSLTNAVVVRIE